MTEPQAEEQATLLCKCEDAKAYQKEKNRKKKALENVAKLFGENAPPEQKEGEPVLNILTAAVEAICNNQIRKVSINLWRDTAAIISQDSKGKIKVKRTVKKEMELTE